jgi:hypothetical protein
MISFLEVASFVMPRGQLDRRPIPDSYIALLSSRSDIRHPPFFPPHKLHVSLPNMKLKGFSLSTKVHFDQYNPNNEAGTDTRHSLAHLDYSPLPRVTMRSFTMGVLISMGGLM